MIPRYLAHDIKNMAQQYPVLAILGPRQSGKTTLAKLTFPNHKYLTLENPDIRRFATEDPNGFFKLHQSENSHGMILDEFQHVPSILSYIQTIVDENRRPGYFVLTGSQNFLVNQSITQTLAGRISLHTLLPLSCGELSDAAMLPDNIYSVMLKGSYPAAYNPNTDSERWYLNYLQTYVERDIRDIKQVTDLTLFQNFVQLCAGRIGQLLNLSSLANDCGIAVNTAKAWISLLEASYIVFTLYPHYKNFSKRLVKHPKLYFYDTGLACSLLKITSEQLPMHYLRGGLFESFVISELCKAFYNQGQRPPLYFWRDRSGAEIDCLIEQGTNLTPIEIKSSMTIGSDFFDGLSYWNNLAQQSPTKSYVIYAGDEAQERNKGNVISWKNIHKIMAH
ncbi:MAG: hypothetical protein US49_C0002G0115 [candidate division TM6 bacterium GW2011_GWF2_37_49]|nr:MAG: hypothetical protein US49_C0002G0115 [candidate division TM6 bacterium GW2011_GWF2_37_49]